MSKEISFKNTVQLPKTEFPIRAQLQENEPALLSQWDNASLYSQKMALGNHNYVLHDGPPYPNGPIHMGHALNKILKDIIIRSQALYGAKTHYVPGWDCHGLPIETQVLKELKSQNRSFESISDFREKCDQFARRFVTLQTEDFKRLGILGNFDQPYLTLTPAYESQVIRLFGQIAQNGLVYKGRKPIHWCIHCETALAEAEIEYQPHRSPSIFVSFPVLKASAKLSELLKNQEARFLVWTTTPWTLPANVALAAHPDLEYTVASSPDHSYLFVFASALHESLEKRCHSRFHVVGHILGKHLVETITQNPLMSRPSPVILANFVTQEDGSGFVHIAPGHGQDDYKAGLAHQLPVLMPVDGQGKFNEDLPWKGQVVFEANKSIGQALSSSGHLLALEFISHSYPHCWRCKNPVIFRATSQWFIAMDKAMPDGETLREKALAAIDTVSWFPDWGKKRITSMVENRPDWCISRQRYWGIPIPVLTCTHCETSDLSMTLNQHLQTLFLQHGSRIWFDKEAVDLVPAGHTCSHCNGKTFKKEGDILDVWFESGASFGSVLQETHQFPADLYLEGSDQHRGWFQSSLLIGLGAVGKAPFKGVLTHGFLVDEKGRKMSKSQGNVISPQAIIKQYGADVLRWWVANSDFKQDIGISDAIFKQMQESFSKVRNTIRFCLSNLFDFNPSTDLVSYPQLSQLDQYILNQLYLLDQKVKSAYLNYDLHVVAHAVHDYCAVTLSSGYLDMVKDRLYCDGANSLSRRSTQTALFYIVNTLLEVLSPILAFTTEQAYAFFNHPSKASSIHLLSHHALPECFQNPEISTLLDLCFNVRVLVYQELEKLRLSKVITSFLQAEVHLYLPSDYALFSDWEAFLIVSQVHLHEAAHFSFDIKPLSTPRCERCWKLKPLTGPLCSRCDLAITPS